MTQTVQNILADFYLRLGTLALSRGQTELAASYFNMANEVLL